MTDISGGNISADAEDQIRAGEELLDNGETEQLIAQAVETIALARAKGRLDIVAEAEALIEELSAQHEAMARAHAELIVGNAELKAAQELLTTTQSWHAAVDEPEAAAELS